MEEKKIHIWQILLVILCVLIISAALVYFAGAVYFRTHLPFHTFFLGYDVSQCGVSVIDEIMNSKTDARTLTIHEMDGKEEILSLSDAVDYKRSVSEPEGGWIPENSWWRWPLSLYSINDLTRTEEFDYDRDMVDSAVSQLSAMDPENYTSPTNARLEWQGDVCVIIPEVDGNELIPARTADAIREAIDNDLDVVQPTATKRRCSGTTTRDLSESLSNTTPSTTSASRST